MSSDVSQAEGKGQIESYYVGYARSSPSRFEYMCPNVHGSGHITSIQNILHDEVSGSAIAVHNYERDDLGKLLKISTKGITVTPEELAAIETYSKWNLTDVKDGAISFEANCEDIPEIRYTSSNESSAREYRSGPDNLDYVDPDEEQPIKEEIERISSGFVDPQASVNGGNPYHSTRPSEENIYIYRIKDEYNRYNGYHMKISTHDLHMTPFSIAFIQVASTWNFIGIEDGNVMFNGLPNSETKSPSELEEIGRSLMNSPVPIHVDLVKESSGSKRITKPPTR